MKKVLCVAVAAFMAVASVHAEEAEQTEKEIGKIGVGYQGLLLGGLLNGVAIRQTPSEWGWQAELMQGSVDAPGANDVDLFVIKGKGYYAMVERENSTFYVGGGLGLWMIDAGGGDVDGISIAPLMGVEWNFAELPELGFNFEVSYEIMMLEIDPGDADVDVSGINVNTGIIYYF